MICRNEVLLSMAMRLVWRHTLQLRLVWRHTLQLIFHDRSMLVFGLNYPHLEPVRYD